MLLGQFIGALSPLADLHNSDGTQTEIDFLLLLKIVLVVPYPRCLASLFSGDLVPLSLYPAAAVSICGQLAVVTIVL